MRKKIQSALGIAVLFTAGVAVAGSLLEATFIGQPQQRIESGEIVSCGLVLAAIENPLPQPSGRSWVFNGSVMVFGPNGGMVKGRASDIDAKVVAAGQLDLKKIKTLPLQRFWIKAPNSPATNVLAGTAVTDSEDPGYKLYSSDFSSTWGIIKAIQERRPIQIGFMVKGRNVEQILFGEVSMTESQLAQLDQCLGEWSERINRKLKESESK